MNKYELKITKSNNKTVVPNITWVYGETIDLAVEHSNYWKKDGDKIGTDWTIDEILSVTPIDYYPYTYEDAISFAIENKIKVIHAILQQDRMADFDKLDLIKVIANESPADYSELDTACRDALVNIINENLCDDMIQLVLRWTEPCMNLTEEDAGRFMSEMETNGYILPIGFTPKDFIELYHECDE